jgi:hypothetical protein
MPSVNAKNDAVRFFPAWAVIHETRVKQIAEGQNVASQRTVRICEILVGAVFLAAAVLKAVNAPLFIVQMREYRVIDDFNVLLYLALAVLTAEAAIGTGLLCGGPARTFIHAAAVAMLLIFTGLVAYAWPKDCGCFGSIPLGPRATIAKNVVLLVLLVPPLWLSSKQSTWRQPTGSGYRNIAQGLCVLVVALALPAYAYPQLFARTPLPRSTSDLGTSSDISTGPSKSPASAPGPFSPYAFDTENGEHIDLSRGEYLVALLSMTCEHCMASVPTLNQYVGMPELPPLVALCLEPEPQSMDIFRAQTQPLFPMHSLGNDVIAFFRLIGNAPPRLSYVRDGTPLKSWDEPLPPPEEVLPYVRSVRGQNNP